MKKRNLVSVLTIFILMLSIVSQVSAQSTFDTDGDGTPNTNDNCPNVPGPGTNNGCPLPSEETHDIPDDTDGDGTADPLDACPTVAGDGANGGCPPGTDPNNPGGGSPVSSPEFELSVAPFSDDCIVSPAGSQGVNIRIAPNPTASVLHVLQANEWATVIAIAYEGESPFRAEHELGGDVYEPVLDLVAPGPDPDPEPDPDPAESDSLWLLIGTDDGFIGWVAEAVIRKAGDCSEFVLPPNNPDWLEVLVLPNDGGGIGFPDPNGFLRIPIVPDPPPGFQFDIRLPDDSGDESLDIAVECVWVELGAGGSILECLDGTTPSFIYCLIQEVGEVGIFQEVCYQVELPDGCTMTTAEAGVWHMECDDDSEVVVTPLGQIDPIFSVGDNNSAIGLLLPAVQAARE